MGMWIPMLYLGLMTSMILGLMSNNWFSLMVCLELNLAMILPILFKYASMIQGETVITYLIIQSIGSLFLLLMILGNNNFILWSNLCEPMFITALFIKLGAFPFHGWFIGLMSFSEPLNFFMLATTQKLLPLIFLFYAISSFLVLMVIIVSIVVPSINLSVNKIKIMLAYSSIFQLSMIMIAMIESMNMFCIYYLAYLITMIFIVYNVVNSMSINFSSILKNNTSASIIVSMTMLMGLPPFMMFIPKLMVLINMKSMIILLLILFITLIINLYIYLRIISQMSLFSGSSTGIIPNQVSMIPLIMLINLFPWLMLV
uniref:NADH-ubiquinone oxidoreductase chain 2 n=1 Tax=Batillipes longispinosus TaxID=1477119 RepID=A0A0K0KA09_9BILA|nr:NADH dehydogenase subunit 2 [Batillipes longispinosus]